MIVMPYVQNAAIADLEALLARHPEKSSEIEGELKRYRAGAKAEKDAAYQIDFQLKDSKNYAVLHGLRLEYNGRVAQIDHLIIDRFLTMTTLETKSFHSGFKVTDDGEFLRWNNFNKRYEKMGSPFDQCERHQLVLKDLLDHEDILPTRLGFKISPSFKSVLLIDPKVRISKSDKADTSRIKTFEQFFSALVQDESALSAIFNMAKVVQHSTLKEVAEKIAAFHRPHMIDFNGKFGLKPQAKAVEPTLPTPSCKHCASTNLQVLYGKFGYYFKCGDCEGNTNPALPGKGKLRKEGNAFYFVPEDGSEETLFYTNKAA